MKNPFKHDVSVLMLFFNRPEHFREVFEEVKKARPARLFLYQDGPRGERDMPGIEACRQIAADANIDWECEVHRMYQEKNFGCDPSEYLSQKWAFSMTDKCIVLEDDDVPSQAFFPFCKELLDKYENDERVWMIAGFNAEETASLPHDEGSDVPSYFFTSVFSIWGWASWRRVIDTWDEHYTWLDDEAKRRKMESVIMHKRLRSDIMSMCYDHKASGIAFYETIFWASMLMNDGLAIMPTYNLINNKGVTDNSTHFQGSLKTMPRRMRRQFTMRRYEIDFPLVHPQQVVEYKPFKDAVYRRNAWRHPWIKVMYSVEELLLNLRYGNFSVIAKAFRKRIDKWLGQYRHK